MVFEHRVTARFYEIDRASIVFFGRFFEYCHATFEEMLSVAFDDIEAAFAKGHWAMPVVHCDADFKSPVRLGDRLLVRMRIVRLGKTSITFGYDIFSADDALHCSLTVVHALIDPETFRPTTAPKALLDGLARAGLLAPTP